MAAKVTVYPFALVAWKLFIKTFRGNQIYGSLAKRVHLPVMPVPVFSFVTVVAATLYYIVPLFELLKISMLNTALGQVAHTAGTYILVSVALSE